MLKKFTEQRVYYIIILAVCAIEISTHWGHWYPDSATYVSTMEYIKGNESAAISEHRLLRPVYLVLAMFLAKEVGNANAFAIINSIFWIATAFLLYRFSMLLLKDSLAAFYSSLLFSASLPLLEYGAAVLTDTGGYFFCLLTFYLLYQYRDHKNIKSYIGLSIAVVVGILTREQTLFFLLIYLVSYEIISGNRRWSRIFWITGITLFFVLSYYFYVGFSPLAKFKDATAYAEAISESKVATRGIIPLVKSVIGAFFFLPVFAIIGLYKTDQKLRIIYLSMFLAVLPIWAFWPVMDYRWFFLMFPVILPLASFGLRIISPKYGLVGVVIYAVLTNWYAYTKVGFQFIGGV